MGAKVVRLMIYGMIAFLLLVGYVFFQSYQGRSDLVQSQRNGCERGKLDRAANAEGWRTAETARVSAAAESMHISIEAVRKLIRQTPQPDEVYDLVAARKYDKIAHGLEVRSKINCARAFPKAGLFP